jgi:hypothetical protein
MDCCELDKRRFIRLNMESSSKVTISEINNKKVKMKSIIVEVSNIGLGGLQFESEFWFPAQESMILKFDDTIFGVLYGFILWRNVETDGIKYGVKFTKANFEMYQMIQKMQKLPLDFLLEIEGLL